MWVREGVARQSTAGHAVTSLVSGTSGGIISFVRTTPGETTVMTTAQQPTAGEIVRETTRDTEAIAQYKSMRETLVYLTHLNNDDTEQIMLEKLSKQVEVRVCYCNR